LIGKFLRSLLGGNLVREDNLQREQDKPLEARVAFLEERLLSYYKNRWDMIDKLADYLVGAELRGDYLEFGVFEGQTFGYAYKVMALLFPEMSFVALDSFEGLPEPIRLDGDEQYSSGFHQGQFACNRDAFLRNIELRWSADLNRIRTVPGWFEETLHGDNPDLVGVGTVAAAWIDCDLYESTIPVLDFLTDHLEVGSVILFDDWRCFRNLANRGEQRACAEWLARNPRIKLNPFVDFGFHGMSFTVADC